MKNSTYVFMLLMCFSTCISSLSAQTKVTQKEKFQSTYNKSKSLVQNKRYQFQATIVFDGNKREKSKSTMAISNQKVSGELTSFTENKVTFFVDDSKIKNYKTVFNDEKQTILIQWNIKEGATTFDFTIEVKPNGSAILSTSQNNLEDLKWMGNLIKF